MRILGAGAIVVLPIELLDLIRVGVRSLLLLRFVELKDLSVEVSLARTPEESSSQSSTTVDGVVGPYL